MSARNRILDFVCCPKCKGDMQVSLNRFFCQKCAKSFVFNDGVLLIENKMSSDLLLSVRKWDELYKEQLNNGSYYKLFNEYKTKHFKSLDSQISHYFNLGGGVFLEIGCGQFFLGQLFSKRCSFVIGVDFCPSALAIAKEMLDKSGIKNYILIQGDINNLPIRSNSIDFLYGGGVIEHFKSTKECIGELFRVLKVNGISFNTVPFLNLYSLTVRQIWGNIPDLKYVREIYEFFHIRILGGRHMKYGYEKSFTERNLVTSHREAGFRFVNIECFFVDYWKLKNISEYIYRFSVMVLNKCKPFWSFVKVVAIK